MSFQSWGRKFLLFSLVFVFGAASFAESQETQSLRAELDRYLFADNDHGIREGARTDAILIMQNGKIFVEKYARGFNENKQHIMWSISKTVTALLFGVAIKEKRARLDQSICDFAKFTNPDFCAITVAHVLTWTTAIH